MLIKAKERKTLVSPAKGVASQEMAGLSAPPPAATTIGGGGYIGENVCQDFYPAGITTALQPTGCPSLWGGLCSDRDYYSVGSWPPTCRLPSRGWKKQEETKGQVRNTAEQLRHGNRCSPRHCFGHQPKRNWAKRPHDDGRNIEDDDYGASRACNPFNVATLIWHWSSWSCVILVCAELRINSIPSARRERTVYSYSHVTCIRKCGYCSYNIAF